MKGIIFAELLGFLDEAGGPAFTEQVIGAAGLPHGGAYARVSRYPWQEAATLVGEAARITGKDAGDLCEAFGVYLFNRFTVLYPSIIGAYDSAEALLMHVENHIHQEVRILYPDAEPPSVSAETEGGRLVVRYESHRPFARIAHGLVRGCMAHFNDERQLDWIMAADDGTAAHFGITP